MELITLLTIQSGSRAVSVGNIIAWLPPYRCLGGRGRGRGQGLTYVCAQELLEVIHL